MTPPVPAPAQLRPDGAYLVVGGLGGLGQAIVRWMGSHGARRIVTVSRSGTCDDSAAGLIKDLSRQGVSVEIERCDIIKLDQVEALIQKVEQGENGTPVAGIIQSAMVVQVCDALFAGPSLMRGMLLIPFSCRTRSWPT
jgi:NAD(P)-dependent dehydrogenase (short-subunit alcohol dehydrogenase family)